MRTLTKVSARLIAAVLAVASAAPLALAQSQSFAAKVTVPFAFATASGQHFQPGVYTIHITGTQTMLIEGAKVSGLAMIQQLAYDGLPAAQGKAVFVHYGAKYYLHSVTASGSSTRLTFARSKEERQSQIAAAKPSPAVELALLQTGR